MKKKFLLAFMLMCISIFAIGGISVSATESGTCGDNLTWTLDDNGTLTISGTGNMENYKFKKGVPGNQSISPWNDYREQIENVIIEKGITNIGDYAFYDCQKLASVKVPDGVTVIGEDAFCRCFSLIKINIPNTVTQIKSYAFGICKSIREIVIPDSVTQIGKHGFWDCYDLTDVTLSKSLTELEDGTFNSCSSLKKLDLHEGLTTFGKEVFKGTNIELLKCPSTLKTVQYNTFSESGIQEIELPEGLNQFPQFTGCKKLKKISMFKRKTMIMMF